MKYRKVGHTLFATVMGGSETVAEISLIGIELAVFGRPVPKLANSSFDMFNKSSDLIDAFVE